MKLSLRHSLVFLIALSLKTGYSSYSKTTTSTAFCMITANEIKAGSKVRVSLDYNGRHLKSYSGTVLGKIGRDGRFSLRKENGKTTRVHPESCTLIAQ